MPEEPQNLTVPVYPFAGKDDATRRAIDIAVLGVEDLIHKLVREAFERADWADRDDMVQKIRVHLWSYALPRFDSTRGVKVSTFLHTCIRNQVRSFFDKPTKSGRKMRLAATVRLYAATEDDLHALDQSQDRDIEKLAGAVIANPAKFGLTPVQCRVLQAAVNAPPGTMTMTLADQLGYANPSSLCTVLVRVKNLIRNLDIAGYQNCQEENGKGNGVVRQG